MWRLILSQHPLTAPWYRRLQGRPPWVVKCAALAALLIFVVPLILLVLSALIVGVAVFVVLSLAAHANTFLRTLVDRLLRGPPDDGRRNVHVVDREAP